MDRGRTLHGDVTDMAALTQPAAEERGIDEVIGFLHVQREKLLTDGSQAGATAASKLTFHWGHYPAFGL